MSRIRFEWVLRNDHSRHLGECDDNGRHRNPRRPAYVYVYFDRNWKIARRRRPRMTRLESFVVELVDTVNHEAAHALAPPRIRWKREERMAQRFAAAARRCME